MHHVGYPAPSGRRHGERVRRPGVGTRRAYPWLHISRPVGPKQVVLIRLRAKRHLYIASEMEGSFMNSNARFASHMAGLALLALAVGLVVYFGSRAPAPSAAPAPKPPVAPGVAKVATPVPTATVPEPERKPAVESPVSAEPSRNTGLNLTGTWELFIENEEDESYPWGRFAIEQEDGEVRAKALLQRTVIEATLDGMTFRMVSTFENRATFTFAGTLNPSYTEAAGTLESVYRSGDPAEPEVRGETEQASLVRLSEEYVRKEQGEKELREKRLAETKSIFEAIQRFAARNGGKYPGSLSQLTPDDLPDRLLVANQPGRQIAYTGEGASPVSNERIGEIGREFREKGISTESLQEYEQKLREVWGGDAPFQSRLLRVEYDSPRLTIDVAPSGLLRDAVNTTKQALANDATPAELREIEYNNLKQLRLICKMFEEENKEYLPGGWLMIYPDYLNEPNILTSPWAPEGTVSYELLFPGETEKRLEELAQQLIDSGALRAQTVSQSIIPAIAARDNLPADRGQPPARAVAFLDGHVEAVPLADWDTRIAPFLR